MYHRVDHFLRTLSPRWRRAFWLVMGLMHLPALAGSLCSLLNDGFPIERLGGCLALSLTTLLFALKVWDVSWLRWRAGLQSCVALVVVVAVLHVDALRPVDDPTFIPEYAALVASTVALAALRPVRSRLTIAIRRTFTPVTTIASNFRSNSTLWINSSRPHCWMPALPSFALRAPPV